MLTLVRIARKDQADHLPSYQRSLTLVKTYHDPDSLNPYQLQGLFTFLTALPTTSNLPKLTSRVK